MLRRLAGAAVPIVITLWMCAAAGAAGLAGLWLDVPFVEQQKNGCGAASIAMVMQYWEQHQGQSVRPEAEPSQIFRSLYSEPAHGIYASAMVRYFQQNGYRAFAFAGKWTDLESELQKGRPLIAALKAWLRPGSCTTSWLWASTSGNSSCSSTIPRSASSLRRTQSRFEREWKATNHWLLLAVPETSAH